MIDQTTLITGVMGSVALLLINTWISHWKMSSKNDKKLAVMEESKIGWKEHKDSIRRIHEKMEKSDEFHDIKFDDIKNSIGEVSKTVAFIKGKINGDN